MDHRNDASPLDLSGVDLDGNALAGWCQLPSTTTAEVVAASGVDLVCLDTQHGLIGDDALLAMLQALRGVPVLVRVAVNSHDAIGRALDRGATGVIVPLVDSAEQAAQATASCAYPPDGTRSFGPTRHHWAGHDIRARGGCVIMIETLAGVRDLPAILAVEGVDAIFVGPTDLALSAGKGSVPPLDDEDYAAVLRSITRQCREVAMPVGVFCGAPSWAPRYRELGFTWLTLPAEHSLLAGALSATIEEMRVG